MKVSSNVLYDQIGFTSIDQCFYLKDKHFSYVLYNNIIFNIYILTLSSNIINNKNVIEVNMELYDLKILIILII